MNKTEAYKAIAKAVEVLEEEGINVDGTSVEEISGGHPLMQLIEDKSNRISTCKGVIVIDDWEAPKQELFSNDPPDWFMGDGNDAEEYSDEEEELDDATDIDIQ